MAKALASVALGFIGFQLEVLWSMPWEVVRVGYGHIGGSRLATYHSQWGQRAAAMMVAGILLFWLVDLLRRGTTFETAHPSSETLPRGLLLH